MVELQLSQDAMSVKPFQIKEHQSFPEVYIEAAGERKITYHRSTDGVTFTPIPETITFIDYLHDPLYGVRVGEYVKITANAPLSNVKIMW